jgi:hypothetical protein
LFRSGTRPFCSVRGGGFGIIQRREALAPGAGRFYGTRHVDEEDMNAATRVGLVDSRVMVGVPVFVSESIRRWEPGGWRRVKSLFEEVAAAAGWGPKTELQSIVIAGQTR